MRRIERHLPSAVPGIRRHQFGGEVRSCRIAGSNHITVAGPAGSVGVDVGRGRRRQPQLAVAHVESNAVRVGFHRCFDR